MKENADLNKKLNKENWYFLSQKGHNSCKKKAGWIYAFVVESPYLMVNKCWKFESISFDSLGEKLT